MKSDIRHAEYPFRDRILDLSRPRIMGVLNLTPDSFSDGGLFISPNAALDRIGQMVEQGADIIDAGGESTRPGSEGISAGKELDRVMPVLEKAVPEFGNTFFSVDTTKYEVAEAALKLGVHMVNDVSGFQKEPGLADLCAEYRAGYILMHSQGDPKTMQENPEYDDIILDLRDFFSARLKKITASGVTSIILDPGIGFGKTVSHNLKIISELDKFTEFGYPLLVGASRKSMIGRLLNGRPVEDRLTGTVAIHYHCLMNGAGILRVHDVKDASDSVQIFNAVQAAQS
ncbi:MAG: dihydropteroate synthase [Balneolaceae bacterium]